MMENVRPSPSNAYAWMEWMNTNGAKGEPPPQLMKDCWNWWQRARAASSHEELANAIGWLQSTAADQLFAVGILSFPPQLRVYAPNVLNVPGDQREFLRSALYLEN